MILLALLQTWHELNFNLGRPEDIDAYPWSAPVSVVVMLGIFFFLFKARRNYLALPQLPLVKDAPATDLTVIIPADHDEKTVAHCVKSFGGRPVIVVDNGSEDRTAQQAAAAGAEVVAAPPLAKGAQGRPNALFAGSQLASTQYILFADANTTYEPAFVNSALQYADQFQLVLLSAFLKQRCVSVSEKLLVPFSMALHFCGVSARNLQDVLSEETLANGQCMLFLRSAYDFFGGHKSVHTSVIEDVAIAQKVKRHRMNMRIMRAEHLGSVRLYDSFGAIWRGFRRNSFRFFRVNRKTGVQVMLTSILLASIVPLSLWLAVQEQWPFLGALLALPIVMLAPWYGGVGRALFYLPVVYIFQVMLIDGLFCSLFGIGTGEKGHQE